jgi:ATP-binding cassette subfamily B protein
MKGKTKKIPTKDSVTKPNIFSILTSYRGMIAGLILFALLSSGINLVIPKIISRAIDNFSHGNFSYQQLIVEFSTAAFFIFIFTFSQGILQTIASERVARDFRTKLINKISQQSYAFIQQSNLSKLLTYLTSDIDSIKMFVSLSVVSLVSSVFIILGAGAFLISINWKLAIAVLIIIPLIGITFFLIFRKVRVLFKKNREIIDNLNRIINESIIAAALVRVLNAQIIEYNKFLDANTQAKNIGISILKLFATLMPIIVFIGNLATLVILALGGHFVISGTLSLGDFAAFNSYLVILIFPIIIIGFISNFMVQASVSYNRIYNILSAPETKETGTLIAELKGNIELNNINIKYGEKPVLKNISFQIKPASKTAIIGPTAAGKTQLLYLFASLTHQDSGEVLFDGIDVNLYNKEHFQNQIGFVFQDSIIFNMSLRENIAFNGKVTDEMIDIAIETSELQDFVNGLPQGLDTEISERGNNLSGGQKQRIMLARSLAIHPRILLLDDFTSRVDPQTEQKILDNVKRNYPDMTLISVTQKIDSIIGYEQIILMEEGEILGTGTHKELMKTSPEYVQIFNSQRSTNNFENK